MFIIARLLRDFKNDLSKSEIDIYTDKLKRLVANYPLYKQATTFTQPQQLYYVPKTYYAFSLDALSSFDNTQNLENVKDNYLKTLQEMDIKKLTKSDPNQLYKIWVSMMYIGFLHRNNFPKKEIDRIVNDVIVTDNELSGGQSTKALQTFFFSNTQDPMGSWDTIRQDLLLVAKYNTNLKKFLQNYGVRF